VVSQLGGKPNPLHDSSVKPTLNCKIVACRALTGRGNLGFFLRVLYRLFAGVNLLDTGFSVRRVGCFCSRSWCTSDHCHNFGSGWYSCPM